jgi:hypothetical protein
VAATVYHGASRADPLEYVVTDSGALRPAARARARPWLERLAAPLLPRDYPASVAPSYARYSAWNWAHTTLGAAAGTLSMQALLVSAGVGAAEAAPAAAALNWCLKDGVGQLATIGSAYAVAHQFDTHPKQWRLAAGWLENGARLLEMSAPYAPGLFLPLASASAVGKAVACLAASASKAALHLSLSRTPSSNLADLTAKAGAQAVVAQLAGTALGLGVSVALTLPQPHAAPAVAVLLAVAHQATLVRALRCVTLNVVDAPKADALAAAFRARAPLPGPDALSGLDDGLFPPALLGGGGGGGGGGAAQATTVRFGGPLHALAPDARALDVLLVGATERGYVLVAGAPARALLVEGARADAPLAAHLHAHELRALLAAGCAAADAHARAAAYARAHARAYVRAVRASGWQTAHTLLDNGERLAVAAATPAPAGSDEAALDEGAQRAARSAVGDDAKNAMTEVTTTTPATARRGPPVTT